MHCSHASRECPETWDVTRKTSMMTDWTAPFSNLSFASKMRFDNTYGVRRIFYRAWATKRWSKSVWRLYILPKRKNRTNFHHHYIFPNKDPLVWQKYKLCYSWIHPRDGRVSEVSLKISTRNGFVGRCFVYLSFESANK